MLDLEKLVSDVEIADGRDSFLKISFTRMCLDPKGDQRARFPFRAHNTHALYMRSPTSLQGFPVQDRWGVCEPLSIVSRLWQDDDQEWSTRVAVEAIQVTSERIWLTLVDHAVDHYNEERGFPALELTGVFEQDLKNSSEALVRQMEHSGGRLGRCTNLFISSDMAARYGFGKPRADGLVHECSIEDRLFNVWTDSHRDPEHKVLGLGTMIHVADALQLGYYTDSGLTVEEDQGLVTLSKKMAIMLTNTLAVVRSDFV